MSRYRALILVLLVVVLGIPLALPFGELLVQQSAWHAWDDRGRIFLLARNTAWLLGGTLLLALPLGTLGALLLYRTDLPLARWWRSLVILALFVPLPLFTSAWQATLGTGGLLPAAPWSTLPDSADAAGDLRPVWKPWAQGRAAASWVHAVAALPWVILIVGQGLRWVERELEEDALTAAGPWKVLWCVTLPRCRAALGVAALWVVLMTATEITVADMMQVRTLAEEVYLQFTLHDDAGLARTVALALPALVALGALVVVVVRRWEYTLPPLERLHAAPVTYTLGAFRWPSLALVMVATAILVVVPLGSLVWKAGLAGNPEVWSVQVVTYYFRNELLTGGGNVAASVGVASGVGAVAAVLGLLVCWLAQESSWFQRTVLILMVACWVLPAPVVGIGLKEAIHHLLNLEEATYGRFLERAQRPLNLALYDGPSGVPIFWAYLIRFFPFAVALQWPVVRHLPPELRDAIRVDGATAWQEFRHLIVPLCWPASLRASLAVAVLALGEIGASKLVWAGWHPFAHEVFAQMHYGVTNSLAALSLVLLAVAAVGGLGIATLRVSERPGWTRP